MLDMEQLRDWLCVCLTHLWTAFWNNNSPDPICLRDASYGLQAGEFASDVNLVLLFLDAANFFFFFCSEIQKILPNLTFASFF